MRKLFRTLVLLVILVAVAGGLYAWARSSKGDPAGMKLVPVEKGSITEKAIAVGQIQPRQKFQVKSKISGIVKRCMVNVGDSVKPCDPLFEIGPDPTPLFFCYVDLRVVYCKSFFCRVSCV